MRVTSLSLLLAVLSFSVAAAAGIPLDDLFKPGGSAWTADADTFMTTNGPATGFRWTSEDKKATARSVRHGLTIAGLDVIEALARFEDGRLNEFTLSLYNRGDAGELSKQDFDSLVANAGKTINDWLGTRSANVPFSHVPGGTKRMGRAWTVGDNQFKLDWSYSTGNKDRGYRFRSEYLRLSGHELTRANDYRSSIAAKKSSKGFVSSSSLRDRIVKTDSGDVFVDGIPMVDQGQKGYCVVATTERVMRHYGRDVDQHQLAQIGNTRTGGGTDPTSMVDALKRLGNALDCKIKIHEELTLKGFLRFVSDYNDVAEKRGKPPIEYDQVLDVGMIYYSMNMDIVTELRHKKRADFAGFKTDIEKYVKKGMPLLWSVQLGKVPEPGLKQAAGGHMRLIIGYNSKKQELIYSDSWGAGHEVKHMKADDAWTITTGLYTIEPKHLSL